MAHIEPIKVAVIGLGRAGYNIHIKRMRGDERFAVVGVTDRIPERMEEVREEFGAETYNDSKELLKKTDAEVVVVATFSDTHAKITRAVLKSGRHAICEKPMADSVADAKSMIKAAEKNGQKLMVHHNYRFFSETRHLLDVIRSGRIGEVFEIRMRGLSFGRRWDWQTFQKHAGGVLNNTCPHFLDIGLQLLEAPVEDVFCDLRLIRAAGDAEDHVKVVLRAANGRVYDMEVSSACKFPEPKWTVLGSNGTLISDGSTSTIEWFDPDALSPVEATETPTAEREYNTDTGITWHREEVPSKGPDIGDFYDNVWDVIREGKPMTVTPEEALEVVKVTQKCKKASRFYG